LSPNPIPPASTSFPTTHWSAIRRAGAADSFDGGEALASLCRDYWRPIYVYVCRQGHSPEDAKDLTQSFILELIKGPLLERADPDRGRFRSFVLTTLKRFLLNAHRFARAEVRGGRVEFVALEAFVGEERHEIEDLRALTPEEHFQRNWALALLDRVLQQLRGEYEAAGRITLFETLQSYLAGKQGQPGYAAVAAQMGLSETMVTVSVHRMRRRYGELLREQIAATVSTPEEVEEELGELMNALARSSRGP